MEESKIVNPKVIIIGGSAGSLHALMQILPDLPQIHSFAIVIVLHRKSTEDTTLEDLIKLKSPIPVFSIEDKMPLKVGAIYVAPSNYHLLFEKNNLLALDTSEKINYSRPSIDVSFESAAETFGNNLVGILLSGSNSDGTAGVRAIQKVDGITVVQDPKSAEMAYMPNSAIENTSPDYILTTEEILQFIISLEK